MSSDTAGIRVLGVSKRYSLTNRPGGSLRARIATLGASRKRGRWALREVSFRVRPGQTTALIGGNGAGKSTLLRVAAGLTAPTAGRVEIPRRALSVLSFGANFDDTLTGRENAETALIINGLRSAEARRRLDGVVDFSELHDAFDDPVRTYSLGMVLRLGFGVVAQLEADAFIIDEVLSVGDLRFQQKCLEHLAAARASGAAILLATHDLETVEELADEAVWLHGGQVRLGGAATEVVEAYEDEMRSRTVAETPSPSGGASVSADGLELGRNRFGTQRLTIARVRLNGGRDARLHTGEALVVEVSVGPPADAGLEAVVGVAIRRGSDGRTVVNEHANLGIVDAPLDLSLRLERLDLAPGGYYLDVGLYADDWSVAHDYHWAAHLIEIPGIVGDEVMSPPKRWTIR